MALKNEQYEIRVTAREVTGETGSEKSVLTITDNGTGIPDLIIDKVFDPFFTTRENGTGLGLSIAKQIVDTHGGEITIRSKKHQGTTIEVMLPLP